MRCSKTVKPRTIFDCIAYGAYSFETDRELIYRTNFNLISRLLGRLDPRNLSCYVHAGSSSEYGDNASGPREDEAPAPNSHYSVSKVAAASLIQLPGQEEGLALRKPSPVFSVWTAGGFLPVDPEYRSLWSGRADTRNWSIRACRATLSMSTMSCKRSWT